MFNGSYIQVILDIAATDPKCKLSFVKSDLDNARKELAELKAAQHSVQPDEVPECDCNSAQGFHEVSCAKTIYYASLRR